MCCGKLGGTGAHLGRERQEYHCRLHEYCPVASISTLSVRPNFRQILQCANGLCTFVVPAPGSSHVILVAWLERQVPNQGRGKPNGR